VITEAPVKGSRRLDEIPVEPLRVPSAAPMEGLQAPQFKAAKKYLQLILVAALTVLAVALVFVLGKMVKNWTPSRSRAALASGEKGFSSGKAAGEDREIIEPGMISLKLRANGKVWVQVKKGDKNLYAGVMDKGDSGAWRSDVPLTVWTGKGENLVFVLNNRDLGVVAEGVVKNIKVSAEGIKIGAKTIPLKE
ncbi:MAG: DUF4115 domain-containing protein, partial [Candidatus Omnitrophica bacterium]|nr:DUF4115 domain-containing protein [Candidatus Omnitrophota bacterium]